MMTAMSISTDIASVRPVRPVRPSRGPLAREMPAPARGVLHATVRGRRVLLAVVVLVTGGLGLLGGQAVASPSSSAPETVSVVVAPGDTLWELALGLVGPGEDVRDVVLEIEHLNGMSSAAIRAGDTLLLPAA